MLEDKVRRVISDTLGVSLDEVTSEAHLVNDLKMDSLGSVKLIMALEREFNIKIPNRIAARIMTVQQIVDYVKNPPVHDQPTSDSETRRPPQPRRRDEHELDKISNEWMNIFTTTMVRFLYENPDSTKEECLRFVIPASTGPVMQKYNLSVEEMNKVIAVRLKKMFK